MFKVIYSANLRCIDLVNHHRHGDFVVTGLRKGEKSQLWSQISRAGSGAHRISIMLCGCGVASCMVILKNHC